MKPISENPLILNLPSVIMSVIFSFLPIRTILSCKSVCKLWCSIIRNSHFSMSSQSIVLFARSTDRYEPYGKLHLMEPENAYGVTKIDGNLCLVLNEKSEIKLNDDGFDSSFVKMLSIVNSCKGLVCLTVSPFGLTLGELNNLSYSRNWAPFFVCNPITSDYVAIVQPISTDIAYQHVGTHAGFGFSTKSDQYKLVRLFSKLRRGDSEEGPLLVAVYTLDNDENWRILDNHPPQGYSWCGKTTFFKGSLHWIIVDWEISAGSIAAFDCEEEIFSLVEFPNGLSFADAGVFKPMMDLGTFQSRLCFCIWIFKERHDIGIWVMDEYGVRESWRKLFLFSLGENPFNDLMLLKPLSCLNNGEILMSSTNGKLISYDVRSNTLTAIQLPVAIANVEPMMLDLIFLPTKNLLMHCREQPQDDNNSVT